MADTAMEVEADGLAVRVTSPDRVIFPPDVTKLEVVEYYVAVGRRHPARAARAADDAGALAEGRAPGHGAGHRERPTTATRFYQKRVPEGRARRTSRPPGSPSPPAATPTRCARPSWRSSRGPRRSARSPSTRGRCAAPTSTTPTSCASTSTRSPAPTSPTRSASPATARELLDELGCAGFPKTSGGRGVHIYVRIEPRWTFTDVRHAAIAFGRELERRMPGRGDHEVVEGGARRAHLRRLQPERARPHDRLRLLRPRQARRARCRRRCAGTSWPTSSPRTSRSRRCRRASPSVGDLHAAHRRRAPTRWSRCSSSTSAHGQRRHAVPARLPEDAGRAQAGAAEPRHRAQECVAGHGHARAAAADRRRGRHAPGAGRGHPGRRPRAAVAGRARAARRRACKPVRRASLASCPRPTIRWSAWSGRRSITTR